MSNTAPWNGKSVTIAYADERTAVTIRTTKDGDNKDMIFQVPQDLKHLYATLAGCGLPVKTSNVGLYGTERREDGSPKHIVASVKESFENAKGEKVTYGYAYSPKQMSEFEPLSFVMLTKWQKGKNGRNFPAPLFLAHATPYEKPSSAQPMGFKRIEVQDKADKADEAEEAPIKRRRG